MVTKTPNVCVHSNQRPIMDETEQAAVLKVMESGMLTGAERQGGRMVQRLEESVRNFVGAPFAATVSSGQKRYLMSLPRILHA